MLKHAEGQESIFLFMKNEITSNMSVNLDTVRLRYFAACDDVIFFMARPGGGFQYGLHS